MLGGRLEMRIHQFEVVITDVCLHHQQCTPHHALLKFKHLMAVIIHCEHAKQCHVEVTFMPGTADAVLGQFLLDDMIRFGSYFLEEDNVQKIATKQETRLFTLNAMSDSKETHRKLARLGPRLL